MRPWASSCSVRAGSQKAASASAHPDKQEQRIPPAPLQDRCGTSGSAIRHAARSSPFQPQRTATRTHGNDECIKPGAFACEHINVFRQERTNNHILCGATLSSAMLLDAINLGTTMA